MSRVRVLHNPVCSKSRGTLALLAELGVTPEVVEYLKEPPTRADLEAILDALGGDPQELVRVDDARFEETGLTKAQVTTRDQVVDVLLAHPHLMQRPVVMRDGRAVIGRPPERIHALLGDG